MIRPICNTHTKRGLQDKTDELIRFFKKGIATNLCTQMKLEHGRIQMEEIEKVVTYYMI